jgi:hypothetical protein
MVHVPQLTNALVILDISMHNATIGNARRLARTKLLFAMKREHVLHQTSALALQDTRIVLKGDVFTVDQFHLFSVLLQSSFPS